MSFLKANGQLQVAGILWLISLPMMGQAQNEVAGQAVKNIGTGAHLMTVALGLAAIVVLIFGLAWLARRAGGASWMKTSKIKLVAALALGTRERLLLVEVGGKQLLLGVTAHNISRLHVFDEPVVTDDSPASDFSEKLQGLLVRHKEKNAEHSDVARD